VIPSRSTIKDIAVCPFLLSQIKLPNLIVLFLRVPATVDIDFLTGLMVLSEYRASTSTFWSTTLWIHFVPSFGFKIEGVYIVEVLSLVINTTMATKDNDFLFEDAGSHIGSWRRSSNVGLVVLQGWLATDSSPLQFFNMKNPSII
jgi:hypothetical protein